MDSSPVQSTSKCVTSDFSIDRILSDESRCSRENSVELPEWLCCTRYRPPRLPRSTSGAYRSRRSGRHARVPFTGAQAAALEAAYARAPYLAPPALRALAAALQLRDDRIKIWFQNRRARERREKCASIAPPPAVTLPPTTPAHTFIAGSPWMGHRRSELRSSSDLKLFMSEKKDDSISSSEAMQDVPATFPVYTSFSSGIRPETPVDIESIDD